MILGILSDPHKDKMNAIPHVMAQFKRRDVEMVICPGDLTEEKHYNAELFGGFPVRYALIESQCEGNSQTGWICPKRKFMPPASNWQYTMPDHRIIEINGDIYYLGHKIPFDYYLNMSEAKFDERLQRIRLQNDGLRWIFGGHTHVQTYCQGRLVSMVNPGAVEGSGNWGYEFAIVDTDINQVVFSRVMPCPPQEAAFTVAFISDSLNVSKLDVTFWRKLRDEFYARDVSHVIHIGNIAIEDIGREEFASFTVHFNLLQDQLIDMDITNMNWRKELPANWKLIDPERPIVDIKDQRFYVKLDLALELMELSEQGVDHLAMKIRKEYPRTNYVLCGLTNSALYYEGQQVRVINPGDINHDRNFATVCFPDHEITFGHVAVDPLPPLT